MQSWLTFDSGVFGSSAIAVPCSPWRVTVRPSASLTLDPDTGAQTERPLSVMVPAAEAPASPSRPETDNATIRLVFIKQPPQSQVGSSQATNLRPVWKCEL